MNNLTMTAMFVYDGIKAIDDKFEMLSAQGTLHVILSLTSCSIFQYKGPLDCHLLLGD
jgi:hypothetical protein